MNLYGIIGFPLTHSFSKQYFTEKIEKENIVNSIFRTFPLTNIQELPALLQNEPKLKGLSVTIPYKEKVLQYVNIFSKEVSLIGATNCISIKEGKLTAYNTDIIGFEKSFVKKLSSNHTKALVLGSGGASKAVQYVLTKLGIQYLVVSRRVDNNKDFITYSQVSPEMIREYTVIINATPLGMSPNEESFPNLPYAYLTPQHYLYDLVYKPPKTAFLKMGEQYGCILENGFNMLIIQAEENWKRWNED